MYSLISGRPNLINIVVVLQSSFLMWDSCTLFFLVCQKFLASILAPILWMELLPLLTNLALEIDLDILCLIMQKTTTQLSLRR